MCIRRETRERARRSLAFPPFLSLIHILPICFDSAQILYIYAIRKQVCIQQLLKVTRGSKIGLWVDILDCNVKKGDKGYDWKVCLGTGHIWPLLANLLFTRCRNLFLHHYRARDNCLCPVLWQVMYMILQRIYYFIFLTQGPFP